MRHLYFSSAVKQTIAVCALSSMSRGCGASLSGCRRLSRRRGFSTLPAFSRKRRRQKTIVCTASTERGSAVIEFVMIALFCVPLLLGTIVLGLDLIREMQVTQVARDAGRMYSTGIDFTQTSNQNLLVSLSHGLNLSASGGGDGVVIFSTLIYVDTTACQAGNVPLNQCSNLNHTVFIKRVVVGNSAIYTSSFGTPSSSLMDSQGNLSTSGYLTNSSARADAFYNLLPLGTGQYAFMAEVYVSSPGYDFWSFLGTPATYARSIF
ncbi:MAG: TadE family protein [Bryobacteraceae bacterium]